MLECFSIPHFEYEKNIKDYILVMFMLIDIFVIVLVHSCDLKYLIFYYESVDVDS